MVGLEQLTEEDVRASVEKLDFKLKSITKEEFANRLVGMLKGEILPKDVQGITDENMERLYAVAYNAFQAGQYEEARSLFQFLCLNDYLTQKYWIGLGACAYSTEDYDAALRAYVMGALAVPADPKPRMRAADCWLALGNLQAAMTALRETEALCGDQKQYAKYKERSGALIKVLETRLEAAAGG